MKKAAIYIRTSGKTPISDKRLDEQKRKCENLIKKSKGKIIEVYREVGGTNGPELQRLLNDAKDGKFDTVVIHNIDRLSRSLETFIDLQKCFRQMRITLISLMEPINSKIASDALAVHLNLCFKEFKQTAMNNRIKRGQLASRQNCNPKK